MDIEIRYADGLADENHVELVFNYDWDEEVEPVRMTVADLVQLRDKAATFIAGQELPGAEIARQRKATGLLGGTQ